MSAAAVASAPTDGKKLPDVTFDGGCHCGKVRFRVRVDPNEQTIVKCNCSICSKKGFLHLMVAPERFTLLSGDDSMTTYTFNTGVAKHKFCTVCGIHSFYRPRSHPNDFDVNVRCLDAYDYGKDADGERDNITGAGATATAAAAATNERRLLGLKMVGFDGQHWESHIQSIQSDPTVLAAAAAKLNASANASTTASAAAKK